MKGTEFHLLVTLLSAIGSSQFVIGQDAISSFSISEGEFKCGTGGNMSCYANATITEDGLLKLTPDPSGRTENDSYYLNTMGVAMYNKPVYLLNHTTNRTASLSISFSFRIESGKNGIGDGLAFVMFASGNWVGAPGGSLGAFTPHSIAEVETLAVEFDTFKNSNYDTDGNHVGIDTTSIKSDIAKNVSLDLLRSKRVYAWVDYDPSTPVLEVRVSQIIEKPRKALINYRMNLMEVFTVDIVWVGFSASNGFCKCYSFYTVYDISLSSSFASWLPPFTPDPPPGHSTTTSQKTTLKVSMGLTVVVTVGVALIVIGGCLLFYAQRKLHMRTRRLRSGDGDIGAQEFEFAGLSRSLKMYNYSQLCAATNNFSDDLKLGEGGFGSVYRGSIPGTNPDLLVAVKKMNRRSKQGEREVVAEVSTIGLVRHRNIVQLLGWCSDRDGSYLLVYEFMRNRSLDRYLFPRTLNKEADHESLLSWEVRFKILGGLTAALEYLHEGWRQQVIHRDVKSSNVMLDDNFCAMLGDFGLARLADHHKTLKTTAVAGTYGYIAPESSMTGKFTTKSDVFAFGAVCLEIVCGRKVYNESLPSDEMLLVSYVWRKHSEDDLLSVVDSRLGGEYNAQEVEVVLLLGLLCSHPKPIVRPTMTRVREILAGIVEMPSVPKINPETDYYYYPSQNGEKNFFLLAGGTGMKKNNRIHMVSTLQPPKIPVP